MSFPIPSASFGAFRAGRMSVLPPEIWDVFFFLERGAPPPPPGGFFFGGGGGGSPPFTDASEFFFSLEGFPFLPSLDRVFSFLPLVIGRVSAF